MVHKAPQPVKQEKKPTVPSKPDISKPEKQEKRQAVLPKQTKPGPAARKPSITKPADKKEKAVEPK